MNGLERSHKRFGKVTYKSQKWLAYATFGFPNYIIIIISYN